MVVQSKEERYAKAKETRDKPENKTKQKEYNSREDVKARRKERGLSSDTMIKQKQYRNRSDVKEKHKARTQTTEYKVKKNTNERIKNNKERLDVLKYYSLELSMSDIPCCKCCGENFHVDFLALDHIAGRRTMNSEQKLLDKGYSSKLRGKGLNSWIIKNDFPEGFQVLCTNCNFAKGMKKNKNLCPHEKQRLEETFDRITSQSSFEL